MQPNDPQVDWSVQAVRSGEHFWTVVDEPLVVHLSSFAVGHVRQ